MTEPLQILLIEDNESDATLLQQTLEKSELLAQYSVVNNVPEMQAALQQKETDLVISDYHLPDLDGEAALDIAKTFNNDLPFILVSRNVTEETVIKMMKAGLNDYLMKDNLVRLGRVVKKELAEATIRRERKMLDNALHKISTAVINTGLDNFLQTMVVQLSGSLKADHAFIGLLKNGDNETVETIAHATNGCIADNFIYKLEGTPCENTFNNNGCSYVENVTGIFPFDTLLKQMQIVGYLGIPLINSQGSSMGVLVLLYKEPIEYPEVKQTILRFYSERIATEMERCNNQKALKESEEFFSAIFKNSRVAISLVSIPDGIIKDVNDTFCRHLGYKKEELVGKTTAELGLYKNTTDRDSIIKITSEKGLVENEQIEFLTKAGLVIQGLLSIATIDVNGTAFMLCTIVDITAEMNAKNALRRSEEKFKSMVHNISDIITLIDNHGNIIYQSASIKQVLGYEETETIGRNIFEFIHPDDIAMVAIELEKTLKTPGDSNVKEYRFMNSTGEYIMLEGHVNNQLLNPAIKAIIVNSKDITLRKKAESALVKQAFDLSVSNKELEQFAYLASHDLQEPLRMVSSFMNLLEKKYKDVLDETATNYIHFAVDGANRMKQLITDLLLYSSLQNKHQQTQPVNLQTIVKEVAMILQHEILANGATIYTDNLPVVMAVKLDMEQLIQNLLSNAIKYQPAGNKAIIYITGTERPGDWLIKVKDNGIGIDAKFNKKVFIMFQRLHSKDEYGGTGIGLAICKKIVERSGGNIYLESTPGEGSTFLFTLPKPTIKL